MKLPWHTEKRKVAREITKLREKIHDEIHHALGHKHAADELKKKLDDLIKYYDCICGKKAQ
jgi:hypothetical protein